VLRGQVALEDGDIVVPPGYGKYVRRGEQPLAPTL